MDRIGRVFREREAHTLLRLVSVSFPGGDTALADQRSCKALRFTGTSMVDKVVDKSVDTFSLPCGCEGSLKSTYCWELQLRFHGGGLVASVVSRETLPLCAGSLRGANIGPASSC